MRTYIICTSPEGNAISNYFFLLARALSFRGDKVILVLDKQYNGSNHEGSMTIYSWPSKRPTRIKDAVFFFKLCKEYQPDVTLGQFGSTNIVLLVSQLLRVPHRIVYWHTMFTQIRVDSNKPKLITFLLKHRKKGIISYCATHILTNSEATKQDLIIHFKLPDNRIHILHYLIPNYFKSGTILSKSEREFALSFVGRLHKSKGHEVIINQLPKVFSCFPEMKLYVIGDGPERNVLEDQCHKLNIDKQVIFVGSVSMESVYKHLSNTLIHISASVEEAFGLVNVEALSAGTPILASKVGGIVDILSDDENGLFFNPSQRGSLLKGIKALIDENWYRYSKNARITFLKTYESNDLNVSKQLNKLDNILNN